MKTVSLVILFPIIFSYLFSLWTKQKIVHILPLPFLFSVFWLYVFGVFDSLKFGIQFLGYFFLILSLALAISFRSQIFALENIKKLFSPGIILFATLSIWSYKHSSFMRFYDWDEFSYWGTSVKALFLFDRVSPYAPAAIAFPEYLPGAPLLPYLVSEISGIWSEGRVYWSYQVLALTFLVGLLANQTWRKWKTLLFSFPIILIAFTLFFNTFQTVYADPLLAIIFGYLLALGSTKSIFENKTYLINLVSIVTYISMLKDIGIYFALVAIIFVVGNYFFFAKENLSKLKSLAISFGLIILAISPTLIFKILWSSLLEKVNLQADRSIFSVIAKIFLNPSDSVIEPYWKTVIYNFYDRTVNGQLTIINSFPISTLKWFLILLLVTVLMAISNKAKLMRTHRIWIPLWISIGFFGYLCVLLLSYLTVFSEGEAVGLASFNRYVSAYLAGILILVTTQFVDSIIDNSNGIEITGIGFVWVLFLVFQSNPGNILTYVTNPNYQGDAWRNPFSDRSWLIAEVNLPPESKVWIIAQHTVGFEFYLLQYELLPAQVGKIPWSIGSLSGPGDIWTDSTYDEAKWNNALNNYDYVFINNVTETFVNEFGNLFEDPSTLDKPGIYKIEHRPTKNMLIKLR